MPKFFDHDEERDREHAAWLRSPAGKKQAAALAAREAENEKKFTNCEAAPYGDMTWSRKRGRWVFQKRKKTKERIAQDREMRRFDRAWKSISERIPKCWGQHMRCGLGWKKIIFQLVEDLDRVWDGFFGKKGRECWAPLQIKEKFGGLRFYIDKRFRIMKDDYATVKDDAEWRSKLTGLLIGEAEVESGRVCEECGKYGRRRSVDGWIMTACDEDYSSVLAAKFADRKKGEPKLKVEDLMDDIEREKYKKAFTKAR